MANEKTEDATPRRREEERKKGNISRSQDFQSAVLLTLAFALLFVLAKYLLHNIETMSYWAFTNMKPDKINAENIFGFLAPFWHFIVKITVPFLALYFFIVLVVVRMMVGKMFAVEKLKPDFSKFSGEKMWNALKSKLNLFSVKNLVELVKSFIKFIIIGSCGYNVLVMHKEELAGLLGADILSAFFVLGKVIFQILAATFAAMLILGFLDKKYQDYEYNKSIKMSKQEVKDEWKNVEGDPHIKSKIKSIQMQMATQKMLSNVPKADVVVTNPTHYAVAIQYDKNVAPAPLVVAKGVDYMAFKIRDIAKEHNITLVENKPLARSLYKMVDVNKMIPVELYVAVAEVLSYVYNKNNSGVR